MLNNNPLKKLLNKIFKKIKKMRPVSIGVSDISNGEFISY